MRDLEALLSIAVDLTRSLPASDRYDRLLAAVRRVVPCDAATLLRLEGDTLVPLAAHGLTPDALGRRYRRKEHPRLDVILSGDAPVRFAPDSPLPDPFDGMLAADPHALDHVHACLGWPLTEAGEVVGALTADALEPGAFDHLDPAFLATLGALAGAALRTTDLIAALEGRVEQREAVARTLMDDVGERRGRDILGTSEAIERVRSAVDTVAASDLAVLVLGETGVGKELVARRIHQRSPRKNEALIHVNCAALPEGLAESELFGHVRGAFTGAGSDRAGKFEVADGGTLFLDEVGELPLPVQATLLRALQEGEVQRVGSDRPLRVDVRVVAATNRDLEAEVAAGRFRADLYHRLAVYPVRVPPLRARRDDIPLLAGAFLDEIRRRLGLGPVRLTEAARQALVQAEWPGNVRELENVLNRAVLHAGGATAGGDAVVLQPEHLGLTAATGPAAGTPAFAPEDGSEGRPRGDGAPPPGAGAAPGLPEGWGLRDAVDDYQRRVIEEAVAAEDGNWAGAARRLQVDRGNLHRLARRLGLR